MKYDPQKHHRRSIRLKEYDYSQAGAYFVTICAWAREPLFGKIHEKIMRLNAAGRIVKAEWKRLAYQFTNVHLDAFVVMPNHVHGVIVINDPVGATRHLPVDTYSGTEPVPKDTLTGPDGSPLQGDVRDGGMDFNLDGGDSVGATRHLPIDTYSGNEPVPKDTLTGPDGSPLQNDGKPKDTLAGLTGSPVPEESPSPRPKGPARGSLGAMIGQFKSHATKRIWALPEHGRVPIWQCNYYEHIIRNDAEWEQICEYIRNNPARWEEDQLHPNAPNNLFNWE